MLVPGFDHDTLIARSGFARVYRAHQLSFDRDVVIKVLEQVPPDDAGRQRFAERCAAMGRLTGHPGIMTVLDSGFTSDGHPYLITPFCPEGSMADRVAADGPLDVAVVVRVAIVATDALAVAHRAGLLHLDVKPENIAISPFGQPALTDFGLTALGGTGPHEVTAAVALDHVAPEVLNGATATSAADLYALGSTLWTLLVGHPPFPDDRSSLVERMRRVQEDPVPPIGRDVPDDLEALVLQLLAKDPAERPTADEVGARLDVIAAALRAGAPTTGSTPVVAVGSNGSPAADDGPADPAPADHAPEDHALADDGLIDLRGDGTDRARTTAVPTPAGVPTNGSNGRDHRADAVPALPLISPDPRDLLTGPDPFAPTASLAIADDPELGPPTPPAPWQGRLTSWDELVAQPVSREVPVVGTGIGYPAAMAAPVGSAPESVAWADIGTATNGPAGPAGPQWGAPGTAHAVAADPGGPQWAAPAAQPVPAGVSATGRRRRWPVILATLVVMLLAAGATLAVLSRSRSDQETVGTTDSTPSSTSTTAALDTTTVPPTTAAPAPAPAPAPSAAPAPVPTTAAPAPAAVTVPAGTGQVSIPAGVDTGLTAAATTAQQAATALADGNWAVARSLIPQLAPTSDRKLAEGWGNLEHATVALTSGRGNPDGTINLRIGVVAHERNTDGSPRTNLYCATWTLKGNQIIQMSDDQVVGGQPWRAGTWADPKEGIDLLRRSCRPFS